MDKSGSGPLMPLAGEAKREYQRQWIADRRAAFFNGKTCSWCPSTERLELHHLDTSRKEAHAIWSWSEARRLAEIAKCIVLCRPCHERAHAEARRIEAELRQPHGTRNRYGMGCRCDSCRLAQRDYNREHPPKATDPDGDPPLTLLRGAA